MSAAKSEKRRSRMSLRSCGLRRCARHGGFLRRDASVTVACACASPADHAVMDLIGDDAGNPVGIVWGANIALTDKLRTAEHIPKTELDNDAAVGLARDASHDHRMRIDGAPFGKVRRRIQGHDPVD